MMDWIDRLKEKTKGYEGFRGQPYDDKTGKRVKAPKGHTTIGYGRNLDANPLTEEEADYLATNDVMQAVVLLRSNFHWFLKLNDARKIAVADMMFNLGYPTFIQFKNMIAALEVGDYEKASIEALDSRWARQVGRRAEEIAEIIKTGELCSKKS